MICVIFTSKLEIPEDGNDVLDDVLDAKQFWYKVYALSVGDLNMQIRLVIQIIYVSWNMNIQRKIIFNYTKFRFYVQIKHFTHVISSKWRLCKCLRSLHQILLFSWSICCVYPTHTL